jgi:O-antigen ligase
VWFNAGFLGLVLFVASQVCIFLRIFHLNRTLTDPEARSILALALGSILGFGVLCLFESLGAGASNLNIILYLYMAVLVSGSALRRVAPSELLGEKLMPIGRGHGLGQAQGSALTDRAPTSGRGSRLVGPLIL